MSPMRSKAGIHFFENWIELLQCEGLEDTHYSHSRASSELQPTTPSWRWTFAPDRYRAAG